MVNPADVAIGKTAVYEGYSRRTHGTLARICDSERRSLRPIGTTSREVAARTGELLADLTACPPTWLFLGVSRADDDSAAVPHVITAGRRLVLIESVAWPPGRYTTDESGRISCDGVDIGQSVGQLVAAVLHWRERLSHGHRVSALVVVHPSADGEIALPAATEPYLDWASAQGAMQCLRKQLAPAHRQPASLHMISALIAATRPVREVVVPSAGRQ